MRHLTASRKGEGGGWHYVSLGREGGYPLGNCANHEPHQTEIEARQCYAAYQRDNIRLDSKLADWTGCRVCDAPTKDAASIRYDGFHLEPLCSEHLNLPTAISALGLDLPTGDSWQS